MIKRAFFYTTRKRGKTLILLLTLLLLLFFHDAKLSVGFENGVSDLRKIHIARRAHSLYQVVHVHIHFFHIGVIYAGLVDYDNTAAAQHLARLNRLARQQRQQYMQRRKREYGNETVVYGDIRVVHGNTRDFRYNKSDNQLEWLHFAELTFAHKPNYKEHDYKRNYRFKKYHKHDNCSMPFVLSFMLAAARRLRIQKTALGR